MQPLADGDVPINEQTFPDPVFRDYVKTNYDTQTADNVLTAAEIANATQLYLNDTTGELTSVAGVEYLTALRSITLTGLTNKFTELDLSANTALTGLVVTGVYNDEENAAVLDTIDVSKNTALTNLSVNQMPKLVSIDVSKNKSLLALSFNRTALKELDTSELADLQRLVFENDTDLATLDVKKNTQLRTLCCQYCALTELDISQCLLLDNLDCRGNKLTALDVSANTKLTSLDCYTNQLTALDVTMLPELYNLACGGNKGLTKLDVSKNEKLTDLGIGGCAIQVLDLTHNPLLQSLGCNDNQLTTLDLHGFVNLTMVNCSGNKLTSLDLRGCTGLTELECEDNQLATLDLSTNTALGRANIDNNRLTGIDLSKNTALKCLTTEGNPMPKLELAGTSVQKSSGLKGDITSAAFQQVDGEWQFDLRNVLDETALARVLRAEGMASVFSEKETYTITDGIVQLGAALPYIPNTFDNGFIYYYQTNGESCPEFPVMIHADPSIVPPPGPRPDPTPGPSDRKSLSSSTVTVASATYSGQPQTPTVTVSYGGKKLTLDKDYTVKEYTNNTNAGTASVTVIGMGTYYGEKTVNFTIKPLSISGLKVDMPLKEFDPTAPGNEIRQAFAQPGQAGDAYITPTLKVGTNSDQPLYEDQDYTVTYKNHTKIGTATVTFAGIGNYTGKVSKTFKITAKSLAGATVEVNGDYSYNNGKEIKPTDVTVTLDTTQLVLNKDYTLSYQNNKNVWQEGGEQAKQPTVTVKGKGNYKDTASGTFTIEPASLQDATVTVKAVTYNGAEQTPAVTVKYNGKTLKDSTDYNATWANNKDVPKETAAKAELPQVTVTGVAGGNFKDEKTQTFTIKPASLSGLKLTNKTIEPVQFSAGGIKLGPDNIGEVTVKLGKINHTLVYAEDGTEDYTLKYINAGAVGTATVMFVGKSNFTGTATRTFKITAKKLGDGKTESAGINVDRIPDQYYTGKALKPDGAIVVKDGETPLVLDRDYTLTYSNNTKVTPDGATEAKKAVVTVKGKGNYTGSFKTYFTIVKGKFGDGWTVTVNGLTAKENAKPSKPTVTVKDRDGNTIPKSEYEVGAIGEEYNETFKTGGTILLTISSKNQNYGDGSIYKDWIIGKNLSTANVVLAVPKGGVPYTGKEITRDSGDGLTLDVTVSKTDLASLPEDAYEVSYTNNIDKGTATVTLTGTGKGKTPYYGTVTKKFAITARSMGDKTTVSPSEEFKVLFVDETKEKETLALDYIGKAQKPDVRVYVLEQDGKEKELELNVDYTVSYSNNTNPCASTDAKAPTVTVKGKGNYSGSIMAHFTIDKVDLKTCKPVITSKVYTGKAQKPTVKLLDQYGNTVKTSEYTYDKKATYTAEGPHDIEIKAAGSKYTGEVTGTFYISKNNMAKATVDGIVPSMEFTGSKIEQSGLRVILNGVTLAPYDEATKTGDYTLRYENNINKGTAKVYIDGVNEYAGTITKTFKITAHSLAGTDTKVALTDIDTGEPVAEKTYTGKAIKIPAAELKVTSKPGGAEQQPLTLVQGIDYTVSYKNNTKAGVAIVTIKGKGNYSGANGMTFTIEMPEKKP